MNTIGPRRRFSNVIIAWKINNISLAMCSRKVIYSPDISLSGTIETRWKLSLDISKEKDKVVIYLEMLPNGFRKKRVKVNWASYVLNENGEGTFEEERSHSFQCNYKLAVQMFRFESLFEKLSKIASDELNIKCHMLVQFDFNPVFPKARVEGIERLSNDLSKLPKDFSHPDVIATVDNVDFSLHHAMLRYRGENLLQLINRPSPNNKVNLPLSNVEAAEALFNYLYSGDLTYVLSQPSLTISDYIERLCDPEMKNIYPKDIIQIESNIDGKEHTFCWIIVDFRNITNPLIGQEFYADAIESRWKLNLYPKGLTDKSEHLKGSLYIEADLVESEKPLDVCLEFSIKDSSQIVYSRKAQGKVTVGTKLGFSFFEECPDEIEKYLIDNSLSLNFTVRIATGIDFSITVENNPYVPMPCNNERSFMILSRKMRLLLESHAYDDFLFEVGDKRFKAHKFLVTARSPVFEEELRKDPGATSFKVARDLEDSFETFLSYMYIGNVDETDPSRLMKLYDIGAMYKVFTLRDTCADLLYKFLDKENALRVLVWADARKEVEIRNAAFQLAVDQGDSIKESPDWYFFTKTMPDLRAELEECLF